MKTRNRLLGAATALCLATTMGAGTAMAAPSGGAASTAVAPMVAHEALGVAELTGTDADGNTVTGTVTDLAVQTIDGQNVLTGTLTGTVTDALGEVVGNFTQEISAPITGGSTPDSQPGGCQILNLDLGPLFLDVLGLQIDLSEVNLDITAVPGAGNLLGNLLCAVAGLLDGPGNPLNAITNLLNRLLDGLGLAA
jgi:hypothetical protein